MKSVQQYDQYTNGIISVEKYFIQYALPNGIESNLYQGKQKLQYPVPKGINDPGYCYIIVTLKMKD